MAQSNALGEPPLPRSLGRLTGEADLGSRQVVLCAVNDFFMEVIHCLKVPVW